MYLGCGVRDLAVPCPLGLCSLQHGRPLRASPLSLAESSPCLKACLGPLTPQPASKSQSPAPGRAAKHREQPQSAALRGSAPLPSIIRALVRTTALCSVLEEVPIHCLKPWGMQFSKGEHPALDVVHNPPPKKNTSRTRNITRSPATESCAMFSSTGTTQTLPIRTPSPPGSTPEHGKPIRLIWGTQPCSFLSYRCTIPCPGASRSKSWPSLPRGCCALNLRKTLLLLFFKPGKDC